MSEYFECYICGQVVQGFVASQQVECCEIPSYQRVEKPKCARCGDTGMIDAGGSPTPETGTTTERPCPLCGPVFASKGPDAPEPAPF